MDLAELEARGLYDPSSLNAADRLALIEWLLERGFTLEQMADAQASGSLTGLAGDHVIRPGRRLTLGEMAERAALRPEDVQSIRRASGFPAIGPDERDFSEADVDAFALFRYGAELFGDDEALRFTRVIGSSLARIAETVVAMFLTGVEAPLVAAGGGELELAKANVEATSALSALPPMLDTMFRFHLEAAIRRFRLASRDGRVSYDTMNVAIGFVDLVGFTPLSRQLPTAEFGNLVDDFESEAHDLVAAHDGRVVKLIGDEVMYVAVDIGAACEIALGLTETFGQRETTITPRGGLAAGEVLTRGGDYYGSVVNVASRVAELAVPHEILVTAEVRERAEKTAAPLRFDPAGRRMLKGFDKPIELYAVSRC